MHIFRSIFEHDDSLEFIIVIVLQRKLKRQLQLPQQQLKLVKEAKEEMVVEVVVVVGEVVLVGTVEEGQEEVREVALKVAMQLETLMTMMKTRASWKRTIWMLMPTSLRRISSCCCRLRKPRRKRWTYNVESHRAL